MIGQSKEYPSNQSCLVIDTTNRWILTALFYPNGSVEKCMEAKQSSFQILPRLIQEVLEKSKLRSPDWIVAAIGPGSFTGVRIGVSFARSLAQFWDIPVCGIHSLRFYCYDILFRTLATDSFPSHSFPSHGVAVMLDSKQKKVYAAMIKGVYHSSREDSRRSLGKNELFHDGDQTPSSFLRKIPEEIPVFTDDLDSIQNSIPANEREIWFRRSIQKMEIPHPQSLYELGLQERNIKKQGSETVGDWKSLMPLYVRNTPSCPQKKNERDG